MSLPDSGPKVSIVLPFRDEERFIDDCLASIHNQTLEAWELIAIDDHSGDRSAEIIEAAAARDRRIVLERNPGMGLVTALNHGISLARAPLIARMDADDLMTPDRLDTQVEILVCRPEVDVVGSLVRIFPRDGLRAGYREYERWQNSVLTPEDVDREIFVEAPFAHPSVTFRSATIARVGGYRDGPFPEDYELWLRMHARGAVMMKCNQILLEWRERPDRASRTDPRYREEAFDRLRASYLAKDRRLHQGRPIVVWGAGRRTRGRVRYLVARGVKVSAWIDIDPRKIGRTLEGAPVYAPDRLAALKPRPLVLVYVRSHGARDLISDRLAELRYEPGRDWLPVG